VSIQKDAPTSGIKTSKKALKQAVNTPFSPDLVQHPPHYSGTKNGVECIDAIRESMPIEEFKGYLKGTVYKYIWRAGKKENANELTDLKKAQWFLDYLINISRKEEI